MSIYKNTYLSEDCLCTFMHEIILYYLMRTYSIEK